jgi:mono/diheme cytochrome c family protein
MKFVLWGRVVAVLAIAGAVLAFSAATSRPTKIAHGKYVVEGVARCGDCHSPHDEKGEPIAGKELRGATLVFKPTIPMPVWADQAPNIAGLRGWETDAAVKFLMTGIAYNDLPARPPMPQYRLNREDAEAVVAYLKSLTPTDK